MPDDLVTAAVFGDQTQAQAARLHLEAAGVPAFLADEHVAGGLFHLATAVGGIKLQVPRSRLDDALRVLDERMPGGGDDADWSQVDVGRPEDEEAEGEGPDGGPARAPAEPAAEEAPTVREERAVAAFRGCVLGVFFFPFLLLAGWRLGQVWSSDERLGSPYRWQAQVATAFIVPVVVLLLVGCLTVCVTGGR